MTCTWLVSSMSYGISQTTKVNEIARKIGILMWQRAGDLAAELIAD